MGDNCQECIYVKNLSEKVKSLEKVNKDYEVRITHLERNMDVEKERTDMIFKMLNEIKASLNQLNKKIEEIESRPNQLLWAVGGTVLGAIIMAGLK